VDIEPDKTRIILTNLDFEIIKENCFPLENSSPQIVISKILSTIREMIHSSDIDKKQILGCGVSVAGVVDQGKYIINLAPNLRWQNINFKNFETELGIPIYLENEANAAALAEYSLGKHKKDSDMLYISIKQGVGTGIIHDGQLLKGKNNIAGEFGHIVIEPEGKDCTCGRKGCWTMYAATKWLIDEYNSSESTTAQIHVVSDFIDKLEQNDEPAQLLISKYINNLIKGIDNIILAVNPNPIVLGGEVYLLAPYILPPVQGYFKTHRFFNIKLNSKILISELKNDASSLGAAIIPFISMIQEYSVRK
jgi:predicted NBD/HSP70 family sugar kinase